MTNNISRAIGVLVLGFLLLGSVTNGAQATPGKWDHTPSCTPPSGSGYSCTIEVTIDGKKAGSFSLFDIKKALAAGKLKTATANVAFISGNAAENGAVGSWSGVLLWDFLVYAGYQSSSPRASISKIVEVVATDGFTNRFGAGEISPQNGANQVILTLFLNGEFLSSDRGFARLIFPSDKFGARNIFQIKAINIY